MTDTYPVPDTRGAVDDHVLNAEGQFEIHDEAIDLARYRFEDWLALALFWTLGLIVFYQFCTRYALNDSAAWIEEIARYFLVATTFVGAATCVRRNSHIQVDFFYRHLPAWLGRWLSRAVDVLRIAFFAAAVLLTVQMMLKIGNQTRMTIVDAPINVVYGVCLFGFAAMTVRSIQVALIHWRRGYSVLERPQSSLADR